MDGNYVALSVAMVVWIGVFIFLMRLDGRVKKLERNQ